MSRRSSKPDPRRDAGAGSRVLFTGPAPASTRPAGRPEFKLTAGTRRGATESLGETMEIGIIGAGHVGLAVGRRLVGAGHRVSLSSARGARELAPVAQAIGAEPASVADAAASELVLLAVPWSAVPDVLDPLPDWGAGSSSTPPTHSSASNRCSLPTSRGEAPVSSSPGTHLVRGWSRRSTRSAWSTSRKDLSKAGRDESCSSPATTPHPSSRCKT